MTLTGAAMLDEMLQHVKKDIAAQANEMALMRKSKTITLDLMRLAIDSVLHEVAQQAEDVVARYYPRGGKHG